MFSKHGLQNKRCLSSKIFLFSYRLSISHLEKNNIIQRVFRKRSLSSGNISRDERMEPLNITQQTPKRRFNMKINLRWRTRRWQCQAATRSRDRCSSRTPNTPPLPHGSWAGSWSEQSSTKKHSYITDFIRLTFQNKKKWIFDLNHGHCKIWIKFKLFFLNKKVKIWNWSYYERAYWNTIYSFQLVYLTKILSKSVQQSYSNPYNV